MRLNNIFLAALFFNLISCASQELAPINFSDNSNIAKNKAQSKAKNIAKVKEEKTIPVMIGQSEIVEKTLDIEEDNLEKLPSGILKDPEKGEFIKRNKIDPEIIVNEEKSGLGKDVAVIAPNANLALDNKSKMISYRVKNGETIEEIASNNNTTVEKIAELNNLNEPYELQESQIIKLKIDPAAASLKKEVPKPAQVITLQKKLIKPVDGKIIYKFGEQTLNGKNNGVNINAPAGTPVQAAKEGEVIFTGFNEKFGNLVIVKSENLFVAYGHMEDLLLERGEKVSQGQLIGHIGATGNVDSPQLHFAIREGKVAVDPLKYIQY